MPFVDTFGQYKHADWPGKLKDEAEFAARRQAERSIPTGPVPVACWFGNQGGPLRTAAASP